MLLVNNMVIIEITVWKGSDNGIKKYELQLQLVLMEKQLLCEVNVKSKLSQIMLFSK